MFPRLREAVGTALDIVVEFSTLGEYRLAASSAPGTAGAPAATLEPAPQRGGIGSSLTGVAAERIVAGSAAGRRSECLRTPAATPAAQRLQAPSHRTRATGSAPVERHHTQLGRTERGGNERRRAGTPVLAEQLCLAGI